MKPRLNIILLVFFHLVVFVAPLPVKSFHHHYYNPEQEHKGSVISNVTIEHCYICEYEFSINDVPKSRAIQFFNFTYNELILCRKQQVYVNNENDHLAPRAPPSLS